MTALATAGVWLLAMLGPCVCAAQAGLDVSGKLDGIPLGRSVTLLEDVDGKLTLEQIRSPAYASRFVESTRDVPSFGYTQSVYWVRLSVHNGSPSQRHWLLELSYPHLDDVTLYVPHADGNYVAHMTGDQRAFSSRDMAYRTFVFPLDEPGKALRTYYMRVGSSSSMTLPLVAWDTGSFMEHQPSDLGALFLFYGIVLVMACYNLCAYLFIRQIEHLHYVFFIASIGLLQFTLSGHTFQFLLPNQMWLVHQIIPYSLTFALGTACYVCNAYLAIHDQFPRVYQAVRRTGAFYLLLGPATMVLPYSLRIRVILAMFIVVVVLLCVLSVFLIRAKVPRARLYIVAWSTLILGFLIYGFKALGILPSNFFTEWAGQIGTSMQLVLLSSALADRVNTMRADLGALNTELSNKVDALEGALTSAENATARAEKATRVKDEFMATMSHELRTPLNAIINVPQGLLRDFPRTAAVTCAHCASVFELERGERVTADTTCPECSQPGMFKPKDLVRYTGKPEHTARYLAMIERSGKHLLNMVNGVLDFSKMEVGRLDLVLESFDVNELMAEVSDEMSLYAERAGVQIEIAGVGEELLLTADPVRVKQVLINLLSNAIKFSDGKGVVKVWVEPTAESCQFFVQDRGIGIAPEHFERIFASFEQVHRGNTRKYGGTGLGLSISRSLVRMHGGDLWVESELGHGATFIFKIPKGLSGGRGRALSTRMKSVTGTVPRPRHTEEMVS
ncbi:MAG: hybrid sensor histidine kinase/response regulator [Myxococcaceae bacterium]|nr:hybrid sensor histidine kinase/response regulator [Myxococcaceae bacterium]